jgi:GAF domain-containing protein
LMAATRGVEPWAENAETRIAAFTELVATAIANAESREALAELADEQAALRRVATLVARGAQPDAIFSAVGEEIGRLFGSSLTMVGRFEHDAPALVVVGRGEWRRRHPGGISLGARRLPGFRPGLPDRAFSSSRRGGLFGSPGAARRDRKSSRRRLDGCESDLRRGASVGRGERLV